MREDARKAAENIEIPEITQIPDLDLPNITEEELNTQNIDITLPEVTDVLDFTDAFSQIEQDAQTETAPEVRRR